MTTDDLEWTHEDSLLASREGWALFDNSDHGFRIERIDDPSTDPTLDFTEPKFESDDDAVAWVWARCQQISHLHLRAMTIHLLSLARKTTSD